MLILQRETLLQFEKKDVKKDITYKYGEEKYNMQMSHNEIRKCLNNNQIVSKVEQKSNAKSYFRTLNAISFLANLIF
jgi:hypothetical protein